MSLKFGDMLKDARIAKGLTLRQCSDFLEVDPSNWSKLERGINPAPKDASVLEAWARYLGIQGESLEQFFDLASLSRREIPADLASDETVLQALPVFFRACRGAEMDDEKLTKFIESVRKLHSADS